MAKKKVTKKAVKAEAKDTKWETSGTKVIVGIFLFVVGFVLGCAASAKVTYNSVVEENDAINAVEPAEEQAK